MDYQASQRKGWTSPGLSKFVPDAALVRLVLDRNGIDAVPPALAHLLTPVDAGAKA